MSADQRECFSYSSYSSSFYSSPSRSLDSFFSRLSHPLALISSHLITLALADGSTEYAIEMIHPLRCIMFKVVSIVHLPFFSFHLSLLLSFLIKVEYMYLVSDNEKDIQRWYFALRSICKPWEQLHTNIGVHCCLILSFSYSAYSLSFSRFLAL